MSEARGHWYLLTGLLIGLALGIYYAWELSPLEYVDTPPSSLRADFKDEYRYLIAASYRATGNLDRARARLSLLGDPDPVIALGEQAQRMLAASAPAGAIRLVADLAEALLNPALASSSESLIQPLPTESAAQPVRLRTHPCPPMRPRPLNPF
jgi:hypothetical protein